MALEFDPDKAFSDHIAEFRTHLEGLDPECARIFFDNLSVLLGSGNSAPTRASRTAFNKAVLARLQALLPGDGAS